MYYVVQEHRKSSSNQVRALGEEGEPVAALSLISDQVAGLEGAIKSALDRWTDEQPMGRWSKSVKGIGPVISAGLLAHIDVTKARTAGAVWRFAGLDPTSKWGKGQKRPYNARLKVLAWKIGESFARQIGRDGAFYADHLVKRKAYEVDRNERGELAKQAQDVIDRKGVGKDTEAYKTLLEGKLPAFLLERRARRWTAKLFLAHWFEVAYELHYGEPPPSPYPIAHQGHVHKIEPPVPA
jgi:hypothetical protein